jgi:hypothetical protein
MKLNVKAILMVAALTCMIPAAGLALNFYNEDFESLDAAGPSALGDAGWLIFANVFGPDWSYWYGYGVFPAPNNTGGFSAIATGEGGAEQGMNQLSVYSDYNNADHGNGAWIEANVFQEQVIEAGDAGETWKFDFDAKLGNLAGSTTALAFIKTLDPNAGYATTNFITIDMTSIPAEWNRYSLGIAIDGSLVGQLLQIGFSSTATNYEGSGVFYDNIDFYIDGPVATQETSLTGVKEMFR